MLSSRRNHRAARAGIFLIVVILAAGVAGCDGTSPPSSENLEIQDWYDLRAVRDNPSAAYILMNDLDSTTAGYGELAGPAANRGEGWRPVGSMIYDTERLIEPFSGVFDGQGYEIRDLFVNRPGEYGVALFGAVDEGGIVKNIGVVDFGVTGGGLASGLVGINSGGTVSNSYATGAVTSTGNRSYLAGGLVGGNLGTVSNCWATGTVTGSEYVGGLVGENWGTVSDSYASGSTSGEQYSGGLVGWNEQGYVSNCYATGSVTGINTAGGLVGENWGTVSNSYASCSIIGEWHVGGLVGENFPALAGENRGTVSNSYYNYNEVLINGENIITVGALFAADFEEWLANGRSLDVNESLAQEDGYYLINDVSDFKQLLVFGQDDSLKFRLKNDLDLGDDPNFYIPHLAGEFDGNGHIVSNLSLNFDFAEHVGLFGCLALGGRVTQLGVENANTSGRDDVGGLVGSSAGTVSNCHFKGDVTSEGCYIGGLVGANEGIVSNSYSTSRVEGGDDVGGVAGGNWGTASNCYATGAVTGHYYVGGLVGWNDGTASNSYSTGSVTGDEWVGGLAGWSWGTVSNCLWDVETSGQEDSCGGRGKATSEMRDITTFTDTGWDIIEVANPSTRNASYIWNIVDGQTYPFLSWQSVS